MVINGIRELMDSLGIPADQWSYQELVERVRALLREGRYSQVVLTGHSLGGGMATVVAALARVPVVTVTPPGIYWSIAKHQRMDEVAAAGGRRQHQRRGGNAAAQNNNWLHHQSVSLLVENDWVNGIFDNHGGLVQMMSCERSEESLQLACHMLEGTICHLLRRCGDPRGRWQACRHHFDLHSQISDTARTVARRVLPNSLRGLLLDSTWQDWVQFSEGLPGPRILGYTIALGVLFFLLLPMFGGFIEEILLL